MLTIKNRLGTTICVSSSVFPSTTIRPTRGFVYSSPNKSSIDQLLIQIADNILVKYDAVSNNSIITISPYRDNFDIEYQTLGNALDPNNDTLG